MRLRRTMFVSVEIFSDWIWVHFSCLGNYYHNRSWGSRSSGIWRYVTDNLRPTFQGIVVSCLQRSKWPRHSTVKDVASKRRSQVTHDATSYPRRTDSSVSACKKLKTRMINLVWLIQRWHLTTVGICVPTASE